MARKKLARPAVRFDVAALLALWDDETPDQVIAEALGVGRKTVLNWRKGRYATVDPYAADRYAIRIGTHPGLVWGEEWWTAALVCA